MIKVGVIGLGSIAAKAYLPIYGALEGVEFHFQTRNNEKLQEIGNKYRFTNLHSSRQSLIESGITGAFVHSATESHEAIVRELLEHDIHVFVDKPITFDYESSRKLTELAAEKGKILMTGFNRRYAPSYNELKAVDNPSIVIVQKNRMRLPRDLQTFVWDDFIHVVDTITYLFPFPIENIIVNARFHENMVQHAVVQFLSQGRTAIGIMNRDNAISEEIAEVMGPYEKRTVYNLSNLIISRGLEEIETRRNDWEPTLTQRGFEQMVDDFIQALKSNRQPMISAVDALVTHELCQRIMDELQKG